MFSVTLSFARSGVSKAPRTTQWDLAWVEKRECHLHLIHLCTRTDGFSFHSFFFFNNRSESLVSCIENRGLLADVHTWVFIQEAILLVTRTGRQIHWKQSAAHSCLLLYFCALSKPCWVDQTKQSGTGVAALHSPCFSTASHAPDTQ